MGAQRSRRAALAAFGAALVILAGCGGIRVKDRHEYEGGKLARPDHIIVYDFAPTWHELPEWAEPAAPPASQATPPSEQELELGRKLGAHIASELVKEIQAMGLPAVHAADQPDAEVGDIAILGYFTTVDPGSTKERLAIGFGRGAAQIGTAVEGYLATDDGMRKLGSGATTTDAKGSPGLVVPLAVTVATANPVGLVVGGAVKAEGEMTGRSTVEGIGAETAHKIAQVLEGKFREQGWITESS